MLRPFSILLAVCFMIAAVRGASAAEGDNSLLFGGSYLRVIGKNSGASNGPAGMLVYRRGLTDDWNLFAAASYGVLLDAGKTADAASVLVGGGYVIDAATWVPEVYVGVGYAGRLRGGGLKPDIGLMGGIGLEYHRWRELGIGGRAEYTFLPLNRRTSGGIVSLGLYLSRYF